MIDDGLPDFLIFQTSTINDISQKYRVNAKKNNSTLLLTLEVPVAAFFKKKKTLRHKSAVVAFLREMNLEMVYNILLYYTSKVA